MNLWGPFGVAWFELRRSLSVARFSIWLLMSLFPILLIYLLLSQLIDRPSDDAIHTVAFFLIVRVVTTMGLLLWTTPVISSEIEGRTWLYAATRPGGSKSIVLGKYCVALVWAISSGVIATIGVAQVAEVSSFARFVASMTGLVILSSLGYGAVLTLLGTFIQRRAMVLGMIYLVVVEGILSALPATFSKLTITYRLQLLFRDWLLNGTGPDVSIAFGMPNTLPPPWHLAIIACYTATVLWFALLRADKGGYLTDPED